MKLRKSPPVIAASMGRMIVLSIPSRPAASPEKNADAASTHSSADTRTPFSLADPILSRRRGAGDGRLLVVRLDLFDPAATEPHRDQRIDERREDGGADERRGRRRAHVTG